MDIIWFRRDLRLHDNTALFQAQKSNKTILPIFIFDTEILDELEPDDARVQFIYEKIIEINEQLRSYFSGIHVYYGKPSEIFEKLFSQYQIENIYCNKDYEPYAILRDQTIEKLARENGISFQSYKDHVIFEENDVLKPNGEPYTIFTPYSKKWKANLNPSMLNCHSYTLESIQWYKSDIELPSLASLGFTGSTIHVKEYDIKNLEKYSQTRDYPSIDGGSYLSPHLRFGTVSIREIASKVINNETFLNELIWREFFIQILFHFPHVVDQNFKPKYNGIKWRNDEKDFKKWCDGNTGYPIVDAGMRQLNQTGYMHNRVRMITASFLCKHLLIDWRWGEAYFAKKLLDFELASNNGNWQWSAGTGCDAAPYFRVFNPAQQTLKFDKDFIYIRKWVPEFTSFSYPKPMVDHAFARNRALSTYKEGLEMS